MPGWWTPSQWSEEIKVPDPVVPEIKLPEVNVIRSKDDADKLALAMHQPDYLRTPRYVFNVMAPIGTARTVVYICYPSRTPCSLLRCMIFVNT